MRAMEDLLKQPQVAYFSMEIAVHPAIPTYSGGLGVLAGDIVRTAADLALPMVGVTLASRQGYVRQELVRGAQVDNPQPWNPAQGAERVPVKVPVTIAGREVWVTAWRYEIGTFCASGKPIPVLMLDTDLPENHPEDRTITDHLYGGDGVYRLRQEIVLGIGGARLLRALGVNVRKYHLNEGHAALLCLELLAQAHAEHGVSVAECAAILRKQCVFTTHTPVAAGHDQFDYELVDECLGDFVDAKMLRSLGGKDRLNMTMLALNLSGWVNGVAQRHAEVSRELFPGYVVHAITNGVHAGTWTSDRHMVLFDEHVPHWRHEPELLIHATNIPTHALRSAHEHCKAALVTLADSLGALLDPRRLTIGFARRMTGYKRPHLVFHDVERLRRIARKYPLQLVFAGKAHPKDLDGKRSIEEIHAWAKELGEEIPVVFLPGYDMTLARTLVAGCDIWLNNPEPPMEASGTSGMKAAMNGVPSLSVLDGWWLEGCTEGVTGWGIGQGHPAGVAADAASLYDKLETRVAPLFFEQPQAWDELMRNTIAQNGALFNSHRMLRRYIVEAYTH
jgi:starch phosphorylase